MFNKNYINQRHYLKKKHLLYHEFIGIKYTTCISKQHFQQKNIYKKIKDTI